MHKTIQTVDEYIHSFPGAVQELLQASAEQGSKILSKEAYEIRHLYDCGDTVILEAVWLRSLPGKLTAVMQPMQKFEYFAGLLELKNRFCAFFRAARSSCTSQTERSPLPHTDHSKQL